MANLIITVISIALVAVAALMGAYYGGTAFMEGQTKANANTIINQMQQIASAWTVFSADNGGNWTITTSLTNTLVSGTPQYLTAIPTPPAAVTSGTYSAALYTATGTTTGATVNSVILSLTAASEAAGKVCTEVSKASRGASVTTPLEATSATNLTNSSNAKFDCVFFDQGDTDNAMDSTDDLKIVYYKVY